MKTFRIFLVLLLLPLSGGTKAQRPITISDDIMKFENNSVPAFSVVIPEANFETIKKDWIKTLQSGTKSKVVEENGKLSIFGAKIKDISPNPVNVYTKMDAIDSAVNMNVAIELQKDKYVSSSEKESARNYLMKFAKEQYLAVAKEQLSVEKNTLDKLQKDLASLERDQKKMEKTNRDNYTFISSEKGRLDALNNQLTSVSSEIASRSNPSENTGMGAKSDNDPGHLKDLEKQLKNTTKDIRATEKRISKAEKEIDDNKREMPSTIENQNAARMKVTEQEAIVRHYEDKLERIKNSR